MNLVPKNIFKGNTYSVDPAAGDMALLEAEKKALGELCSIAGRSDPASRRIQVEQCWRAQLYQRGYQRLLPQRNGGWGIPGADSRWGSKVAEANTDTGEINIYSRDHDIIVSALSSEVPNVRFFPHKTSEGPDVTAADAANSYKYWFTSSNSLATKLGEIASSFYTDGLAVCFTRSVQSSEFGYVDTSDEDPVIPETEAEAAPVATSNGEARIREVVTVFDALHAKLPTSVQRLCDMPFLGISWEEDETISKATFPERAAQIKATGAGIAELELDRTARLNVTMNMGVGYTTGDTLERQCTRSMWFLRPAMFMEFYVKRRSLYDSLIGKFPDGVLVEYAGQEMTQATAAPMDDHIVVLHSNPGKGQNRRSLGHSSISLQDRLNRLSDLQMDYFTRTVPNRYYDAEAFDLERMQQQSNLPGASHPFIARTGVPFGELMGTDPAVQAHPEMLEFIDRLEGQYSQDMTGALPSLFGGASDTNTFSNAVLQRNQALQRQSWPWGQMTLGVCLITKQAVQEAAKNGNDSISDTVKGVGRIQVEMSDLRGNVLCYPTSDSSIPESWAQRQSLFLEAVQQAGAGNQFYANLITVPANSRVVKDAIGFAELEVPGAASTEKQQAEFDLLKKGGPVPNPQLVSVQQQIEEGQQHAAVDPEAAAALAQLQQVAATLPPEVSTVTVMQDGSEEHTVEAAVCQTWLISAEGRTYKNGTEEQRAAWANVHLHWQEHSTMAAKLTPAMAPQTKASITIALDKLPPNVQTQILKDYGLETSAEDFEQGQTHETTVESETPTTDGGKVKQTVSIAGAPLK